MGIKCPKCQSDNPESATFCADCGTKIISAKDIDVTETIEVPKEELAAGSIFAGRYQIIEELGKGGMGTVYRAHDQEINENVAIKLLKAEIAREEKTIERFRNELKIARSVSHKHVCRMYDIGREDKKYFITMEYVSGKDLKSLIREKRKVSESESLRIGRQICEGLTGAHEQGIVHRDLKPQNIMIDKNGQAKIMDFGIARSVEAPGMTQTGVIIGTPDYISPEQAEGKEADHRSDIYALGVILFEMITGSVPFQGDTALSVALKHKTQLPVDPRKLNPDVSESMSRLVLVCLEKDKERRYQSAEELLDDLRNIKEGFPLGTKIRPRRETFVETLKRKKLFVPVLIFALAIIALGVWKLLPDKDVGLSSGSVKPSLAVVYFENNTGDEGLDHWRKGLSNLLISDLSQSRFLTVLPGERLFQILDDLNQTEAESYSSDVIKEIASQGKIENIISGSYAKAGETYRIIIMLQNVRTEETIFSERVEGEGVKSFFSLVDELTLKIKAGFSLSAEEIASDIDKEVGKITTSFPEAYKYYIEGRDIHHKGDPQKAIELMKKAISVDPNFALAYRSLWSASGKDEYLQKAFELRSQLSDKERLWIEGNYNGRSEKTKDKAIEAFRKIAELYPESRIGHTNLGFLYNSLEEWDKAIESFRVPIQNKEEANWPYQYQAISYMAKGLYDKAKDILEYYLSNFSDHELIRRLLVLNYLCQAKYDLALAEAERVLLLDPSRDYFIIKRKGDIYLCQGDLIKAEQEYQKLKEKNPLFFYGSMGTLFFLQGKFDEAKNQIKNRFPFDLAYMYLKSEKPDKALEECNKALSSAVKSDNLAQQRQILHYKGLAYLEMDSVDEAQKTADELKKLIDEGMIKKHIRFYIHLLGRIELKKDNIPEAIEYFKEAISCMPSQHEISSNSNAIFLDSLAYAYYKTHDFENALAEYERIASLTVDRINYGDIYAKSFYMLGKIYEQKGWEGKAIENYEKFLALWKDADNGIAEVEDARNRLAGLKSY